MAGCFTSSSEWKVILWSLTKKKKKRGQFLINSKPQNLTDTESMKYSTLQLLETRHSPLNKISLWLHCLMNWKYLIAQKTPEKLSRIFTMQWTLLLKAIKWVLNYFCTVCRWHWFPSPTTLTLLGSNASYSSESYASSGPLNFGQQLPLVISLRVLLAEVFSYSTSQNHFSRSTTWI